jgi:hypothetical protein
LVSLGLVSVLLIVVRIVDPPVFDVEPTITTEGAVQFPIYPALLAAAGIAYGGFRAMREEGVSLRRPDIESESGSTELAQENADWPDSPYVPAEAGSVSRLAKESLPIRSSLGKKWRLALKAESPDLGSSAKAAQAHGRR